MPLGTYINFQLSYAGNSNCSSSLNIKISLNVVLKILMSEKCIVTDKRHDIRFTSCYISLYIVLIYTVLDVLYGNCTHKFL
jgi:hypothetical protein